MERKIADIVHAGDMRPPGVFDQRPLPQAVSSGGHIVVRSPDYLMSCECIDFARNSQSEMTFDDLEKRKKSSKLVALWWKEKRYGLDVYGCMTIDGKKGHRQYDVSFGSGEGDQWLCKHCIAVLAILFPSCDVHVDGSGDIVNGLVVVKNGRR